MTETLLSFGVYCVIAFFVLEIFFVLYILALILSEVIS
jgi:hypothetical protein